MRDAVADHERGVRHKENIGGKMKTLCEIKQLMSAGYNALAREV